MASYTIELRNVCAIYGRDEVENWFKDYNISNYLTPSQIETIEKAGLWSKDKLAEQIVDHYYMREIGLETPALFKHYAKVYMREIMERALPRIYSNSIQYDPMINVDFTESFERNIDGNSSTEGSSNSNSNSNSSGMNINNNTPQRRINKQDLNSGIYASSTSQSDTSSNIMDNTTNNSRGSSNTLETYTRKQKGNSGALTTAQALIKQYRDIIIDIDEEIINELNKLFMGLY